jgi:hypothetical protein
LLPVPIQAVDYSATLRSPDIEFTRDEYQYTEGKDSVYTVRSFYYTGHPPIKTNFVLKMKYTGGGNTDMRNWELVSVKGQ